jgi:hypothetical protein
LIPYPSTYTKINSKWVKNSLEEDFGEMLQDGGLDSGLLDRTLKAQATKPKKLTNGTTSN